MKIVTQLVDSVGDSLQKDQLEKNKIYDALLGSHHQVLVNSEGEAILVLKVRVFENYAG